LEEAVNDDPGSIFATCRTFESYKRISDTQVAVWVSDYLQDTEQGLGLAVKKIPYRDRMGFSSYRYAGEYRDENGRWWLIDVVPRKIEGDPADAAI
jgi:hypothetical protein